MEEDPTSGERREWPVQREELDDHYECVERMLGAQQYPFTPKPYSDAPKTKEFIAAAEKAKPEWDLPKLAVTFADVGRTGRAYPGGSKRTWEDPPLHMSSRWGVQPRMQLRQ